TLNPMNGPSDSHHLLLGFCGSVSFQRGLSGRRAAQPMLSIELTYDPPHATYLPSALTHHSATLPARSQIPDALGCLVATWCVLSSAFSANHATASALDLSNPSAPPARQARSHSASVGRRYLWPVFLLSHL